MTDELELSIETAPSPADVDVVQAGLRAFDVARIGEPNEEPVTIFLREGGSGRVVGGVLGLIRWRWLYVAKLWVREDLRGRGAGSRLMAAVEAHARTRGCLGIHLDTFEFQARPFYEKLGFRLFGTLEGFPPAYRQFYLAKPLSGTSPAG